MPSAGLPTEAERSQAAMAGKAQVLSEAKGEKEQRKDCALTDEDFCSREKQSLCVLHVPHGIVAKLN